MTWIFLYRRSRWRRSSKWARNKAASRPSLGFPSWREHRAAARRGARPIDPGPTLQPSAEGLATDVELITPQHPQGDDFAAPAAAEETTVAREFATAQGDADRHAWCTRG